ncbi:MAG: sensor histidine kinase [Nitrososphaerales archaeon]
MTEVINERPTLKEDNASVEKESKNISTSFQDFVTSHYLGFSFFFSILLIISGLLFVAASLPGVLPENHDFLSVILSPLGERILFLGIGALLLVAPLFLNTFVFHALNYERELRVRAQKSTREAQLLQDILTHDVRNYNQVSRLSAELLADEFKGNDQAQMLVSRLLDSIDGSSQLVERAKMLGKVISDYGLDRQDVNLVKTIKKSMDLISSATRDRAINTVIKLPSQSIAPLSTIDPESSQIYVLADDLLEEVFANLFSNAVKYSDGEVFVGIEIREEHDKELRKNCWKISISDTGKGIPDEIKSSLFSRYLEGAKGSGLGMSIVHALVVGRYGGRIQVRNRMTEDHSKGTLIELWLPKAD